MNQILRPHSTDSSASALVCYHCALPIVAPGQFSCAIDNSLQQFCCGGCQAIAELIELGGFGRYYELREQPGQKPEQDPTDIYEVLDQPKMQTGWVSRENHLHTGELIVEGIRCAACIWLIESWMQQLPGVESAYASLSNSRLSITWSAENLKASDLFRHLNKIGYSARPYSQAYKDALLARQRHDLLKRLGIAGVFGMQIMVLSIALYAGGWFGIEPVFRDFLGRVNLLLVLPIFFFSARPFFEGAWRSVKTRSSGMDLPVSIGLSLAFFGSSWAVVSQSGDTYFDSIAMFVFFLLGARYLELIARIKGGSAMDSLTSAVPEYASRYSGQSLTETPSKVSAAELNVGDLILVKPGELLPADGVIVNQSSTFDESLLTGEHAAVLRSVGHQVFSGAINIEQPVSIRVNKAPENTVLSAILRLAKQSAQEKPKITLVAERIASWFIVFVILVALAVAATGLLQGNENWLATTIAVLVVTCPCALSLATPLAITASINALMQRGVFVAKQHAIETMGKIDHVLFDKTGTLTSGTLELKNIETLHILSQLECLHIAASLEQFSEHPIAKSLLKVHGSNELLPVSSIVNNPGLGITGTIAGENYFLGSVGFVTAKLSGIFDTSDIGKLRERVALNDKSVVVLGTVDHLLAIFTLQDQIRPGIQALLEYLASNQINVSILSGDRSETVADVAQQLKVRDFAGGCQPSQKLDQIKHLRSQGRTVCMVGDGVNDTPALSGAHLAIACAGSVNLTSANADIVLTNQTISTLQLAHAFSRKTTRVIRQNIAWALLYNVCAVPAAAMGWVPPWLAGIGMSLSSVIVVANASRLTRIPDNIAIKA